MLKVAKIHDGVVIDHINAGLGIRIFNWLGLGKVPYTVSFLCNAESKEMGRKDIIKIDNDISINLDVLGLIDSNITVNIIKNGEISEKFKLKLPERVENVLHCINPRCITSSERSIPHIFRLVNREKRLYACEYCDELLSADAGMARSSEES
jgi:aspartate carbamoyltransferase regulatory subunit